MKNTETYPHHAWAQTPPLGWNSFICYGSSVTERQFKENVDAFADKLASTGWEYCVLDFCWSHPDPGPVANPNQEAGYTPHLASDEFGRLLPAVERFPSAANGAGLKPLADYTHSKGLKFGLHIMRGIPRQAVEAKTPVKGTNATAADIAQVGSKCTWLNHMYGVDMEQEAAQAYYDSLFELYAEWGVDYIKADDILTDYPGPYHAAEIEAIHKAIAKCGRPMVLSLSPGPAPVNQAQHLGAHANMWRMSADFWDRWRKLYEMFYLCNAWTDLGGPGYWPDADMLPMGRIALCGPEGEPRDSLFTTEEQRTMMTLWSIFRSPLMLGGDVPTLDETTLSLLTNEEVLAANKYGENPYQLYRHQTLVAWISDDSKSSDKFLALFNLADKTDTVPVTLEQIGLGPKVALRDLWKKEDLGATEQTIRKELSAHDCAFYRVSAR
ncbi:glycoside hydrolase family 27 protein [Pelagicoccus sp. NFK12]|uniref:Alpha-galactosidase n=1 Tax=Pelagicoccus enzymogenes TaxID=2773457 RepID=A0A927F6N5_9BACT|nr:glycoside hydrolase family 27 protein [Pelagicoccus enzymogenes]MBD5777963.1 glycoside hydrolase family 27 protein [Pelagicoccus enzymogenes]